MAILLSNYHGICALCLSPLLFSQLALAQTEIQKTSTTTPANAPSVAPPAENIAPEALMPEDSGNVDPNLPVGTLTKPTNSDLDPDLSSDEDSLKPDPNPEDNPANAVASENFPENFLFGATIALTVPHVRNFALESVFYHNYGVSLNYGTVTESIDSIAVAVKHADVRVRWFPWQSSFFAGLVFGQHTLNGELSRVAKIPSTSKYVAIHGKLEASANYFAPQIGWFAMWDGGITLGADIGYLIPSKPTYSFSSTVSDDPVGTAAEVEATKEYADMKGDLESSAKTFISKYVPMITIIRMGWMF
jgi:hypothetical protein